MIEGGITLGVGSTKERPICEYWLRCNATRNESYCFGRLDCQQKHGNYCRQAKFHHPHQHGWTSSISQTLRDSRTGTAPTIHNQCAPSRKLLSAAPPQRMPQSCHKVTSHIAEAWQAHKKIDQSFGESTELT